MYRVAAKGIGLGICAISAWTVKSYLLDQVDFSINELFLNFLLHNVLHVYIGALRNQIFQGQLQHVRASPDVSINPYQTPLPSRYCDKHHKNIFLCLFYVAVILGL